MKKLALYLLLLSAQSHAQQLDSTEIKINQLKQAVTHMADNLQISHKQYLGGVYLNIGGLAVIGSAIASKGDVHTKGALATYGSMMVLLGTLVIMDSHRFIGRAGKWKFSGDKFVVDF